MSDPRLAFTKLCVTDLDRSADFYVRGLGMKETQRIETPELKEIVLGFADSVGGASLVLMKWIPEREVVVGHEHGRLGIITTDLDGLLQRVRDAGFEVAEEPRSAPGGGVRVGFLVDPDGYAVEVVQVRP